MMERILAPSGETPKFGNAETPKAETEPRKRETPPNTSGGVFFWMQRNVAPFNSMD